MQRETPADGLDKDRRQRALRRRVSKVLRPKFKFAV